MDRVVKPIDELTNIANELPLEVLQDINQRITDWASSGGSLEHPYIEQQLRFAKNYLDRQKA